MNEYRIEIKYLKQSKDQAAQLKADLEDQQSRYEASRENVTKIQDKLEPLEVRVCMHSEVHVIREILVLLVT